MTTMSPTIQNKQHARHRCARNSSMVQRSTQSQLGSFLHPTNKMQLHRHALSVDETGPHYHPKTKEFSNDGMNEGQSNRVRDRTKRSDTARRHVLSRQKPIEKEEPHSPRSGTRR